MSAGWTKLGLVLRRKDGLGVIVLGKMFLILPQTLIWAIRLQGRRLKFIIFKKNINLGRPITNTVARHKKKKRSMAKAAWPAMLAAPGPDLAGGWPDIVACG